MINRIAIYYQQFNIKQPIIHLQEIDKSTEMFQQNHKEEGQTQQHPPNNTLYINNLNEKIPIDELKEELFNVFEQYGEIVDIVAKRNILMRGQAFIIFKDINSAMEAKQKKSGKQLHGKTLKISFAKEKSDPIAKIEGTFHIRERPADYFQQKFFEKFVIRPQQVKAQKVQRQKNISRKTDKSHNLPNHILFCQGLNGQITKEVLTIHFMKYPGLVDVRLAPKNYAFIEYTDEFKAGTALAALNGFQIGDCALQLSYAKR